MQFFWLFCAGVCVFELSERFKLSPRSGDVLAALGIGVLAYSCALPMLNWLAGLGAVLLVAGLYWQGPLGSAIFANPIAVFVGEISYALYLSHIMVLWGTHGLLPNAPTWPTFIAKTALALAVATALFTASSARRALGWGRRGSAASAREEA